MTDRRIAKGGELGSRVVCLPRMQEAPGSISSTMSFKLVVHAYNPSTPSRDEGRGILIGCMGKYGGLGDGGREQEYEFRVGLCRTSEVEGS